LGRERVVAVALVRDVQGAGVGEPDAEQLSLPAGRVVGGTPLREILHEQGFMN